MHALKNKYSELEIKEYISSALETLRDKDSFLIEKDVHERSITHHLAKYLEKYFLDFDIDCEYNKCDDNPKKLSKIFDDLERQLPLEKKADTHRVYPDIIIHKRGTTNNLLVIEVKKDNKSSHENDIDKLKAYKNELGYKYAVHLTIEDSGIRFI